MKPKIAVALSGGVDSAVSAALLKREGYEVIGIFMKNWSDPIDQGGYCPWIEDQLSARNVAQKLKIPFYTFNYEQEYKEKVLNNFLAEYKAGRTPNPDVLCNREIKFNLFLQNALKLGSSKIATGHYAQIKKNRGKIKLYRGKDSNKDQSYFLWMLESRQLKHSIFPIGHLAKTKVRALAKKFDLPNALRKDSQGVCFVGPIDVYDFLKSKINPKKGEIINSEGNVIGSHDGIFYYTIGQRHGLNIDKLPGTNRPPVYIKEIIPATNQLVVGMHHELYTNKVQAGKLNWLNQTPKIGEIVQTQVRYRQKPIDGKIIQLNSEKIEIEFLEPVWAVTKGQSLVIYSKDELLGGGIIGA